MRITIFILILTPILFLFSCEKPQQNGPVIQPPADTSVHVTGLGISVSAFIMLTGTSKQLVVNFIPANTSNKKLIWSSSNSSIATVDSTGLVTAVATGTADITATSLDRSTIKITATVRVLKNYDVYVVGKGSTEHWTECAVYWKNGIPSELPGGYLVGSDAFAVLLSGNDVYIAGTTVNSNLWDIPTYWKNNLPVQVGDPNAEYNTYARSIAVSGSSVYMAGYSSFDSECPAYCFGRFRASYWISDGNTVTHVPLCDSIASTFAYAIALSGSDVIVAGSQANDNFYRWSAYWKNDFSNAVKLSNGPTWYQSTAISMKGADVYIAGYGSCPNYGCIDTAKLWKNNMSDVVLLTDGSAEAQPSCIAISGDIIYVGGFEKNSKGKTVARYWKINGSNISSYALTDGAYDAAINAITVSGDDIFLAGYERDDSGKTVAKYWRAYAGMSLAVSLPSSQLYGQHDAVANGICIK